MSSANEISNTPKEKSYLFFNAYLLDDDNNNHSAAITTAHDQPRRRPQSVRIHIKIRHHHVFHNNNLSQTTYEDGLRVDVVSLSGCPLQVFDSAEDARLLFESIILAYTTATGAYSGALLGLYGQGNHDRLRGPDEVMVRLSQTAVSIVHDVLAATGDNSVEVLTIAVEIFRQIVVHAYEYGHLDLSAPADDDNRRVVELATAAELFETVRYDGDGGVEDLECVICLKEVMSGTHVAWLPCAHRFHENCIVPWLRRSRTCPLCRFRLVRKDPDQHFLNY